MCWLDDLFLVIWTWGWTTWNRRRPAPVVGFWVPAVQHKSCLSLWFGWIWLCCILSIWCCSSSTKLCQMSAGGRFPQRPEEEQQEVAAASARTSCQSVLVFWRCYLVLHKGARLSHWASWLNLDHGSSLRSHWPFFIWLTTRGTDWELFSNFPAQSVSGSFRHSDHFWEPARWSVSPGLYFLTRISWCVPPGLYFLVCNSWSVLPGMFFLDYISWSVSSAL